MNLQSVMAWVIGIVLLAAAVGKLDALQTWVWTSEARTIEAGRTSSWGSPRFFPQKSNPVNKDDLSAKSGNSRGK
jgi:predicted outer membrane lipoprotein